MSEARRIEAAEELQFHELSNIFPLMTDAEFKAFVEDIREHGQRELIVTLDGQILDGRNRYRACIELGIEPLTVEWSGIGSPQAFVVSHNLHRRHLTESQRAMVAARIATRPVGNDGHVERAEDPNIGIQILPTPTVEEAAKLLNIGKESVSMARKILNEATPEEVASVDAGEIRVSTLARELRQNTPPDERKTRRATVHADRVRTQQMNGQLWGSFRDAINNLSGLPDPEDMLRIVKGNDKAKITGTKLPIALNWLKEFSDVWNRS